MGDVERRRSQPKDGDYTVGYRKPPLHSRWKPGQSAYPKGRDKGTRNFKTDVKATLKAPVQVTRGGKPRKISTQEAMLLRLREKALAGDVRALDRLIQLAQTYNNDELAASVGLTIEDENVLRIYRSRVLSGAARPADLIESTDEAGSNISGSVSSAETVQDKPKPRAQVERYRPRAHNSTGDGDQQK
jgi:hypothetical protein